MKRRTVYDQQGIDKFAIKLKQIRKENSLTQEELALRSGLALSQIARMETSRINPTLSTICKLARTLNLKPGVFLDFELPPKTEL